MTQPLAVTNEMIYAVCPDGRSIKAARDLAASQFRGLGASADGTFLQAHVRGSDPEPYRVEVDLADARARFSCTCVSPKYPCKHAIGLLLQRLDRPEAFADIAPEAPRRQRMSGHSAIPYAAAPAEPPPAAKDEGEAMLRAVYEEPDDDAPRLIYADWLEERGGEEGAARANFIRLQCELARLPEGDARRDKLARQANALLKKHRPKWMADIPAHLRGERVEMVRGFPGRLNMTATYLERHGPDLVERYPITAVRMTGAVGADEAGDLALLPLWGRIRALDLLGKLEQKERALRALLASPYLTSLRRLNLPGNGLALPEVQALAAFPGLGQLEYLNLSANKVNARSLAHLLAAGPGRLRVLGLSCNNLETAGAEALAAWRPAAPLEELALSSCGLTWRSVEALLKADFLKGLRRLWLLENDVGATGARLLAECPGLEKIEALGLAHAGMDGAAKQRLRDRFGERVVLD